MHTTSTNSTLVLFDHSKLYHRYLFDMVITDALMQFATICQSFWFLDVVASYQHQFAAKKAQVWTVEKYTDTSAWIVAKDSQGNLLIKQKIKHTHFETTETIIRVCGKVMLLSSEV